MSSSTTFNNSLFTTSMNTTSSTAETTSSNMNVNTMTSADNSTGSDLGTTATKVFSTLTETVTSISSTVTSTPMATSPTNGSMSTTPTNFSSTDLTTDDGETGLTNYINSTLKTVSSYITSLAKTTIATESNQTTMVTSPSEMSSSHTNSVSTNEMFTTTQGEIIPKSWLNIENPIFITMLVLCVCGAILIAVLITVIVLHCSKRKNRVRRRSHGSTKSSQVKGRYMSLLMNDFNEVDGAKSDGDAEGEVGINNNGVSAQNMTTFQRSASLEKMAENDQNSAPDTVVDNHGIPNTDASPPASQADNLGKENSPTAQSQIVEDSPKAVGIAGANGSSEEMTGENSSEGPIYDVPPANNTLNTVTEETQQWRTSQSSLPEPPPDPMERDEQLNNREPVSEL